MTTDEERDRQSPCDGAEKERVIIPFDRPGAELSSEQAEQSDQEGEAAPGELNREEIKGVVEALLFASGAPLSSSRLAELAGVSDGHLIRSIVEELKADYDGRNRAFAVEELAGGYRLLTRPDFHPWVSKLRRQEQEETLSQAALETLAIVAYRQPVMRAEIEDVRGVQSGYILRSLIEKSLVRVTGRGEELGRPLLYGTTRKFLDVFGLSSLRARPKLDDLESPSDAE